MVTGTWPTSVRVSITTDPAGRWTVLVQLQYGWVTLLPDDARWLAEQLLEAAGQVDELVESF